MEQRATYLAAPDASVLEQVVIHGDLSKLTPAQRVMYYQKVCESLSLNPLTKPFDYIVLNGRLTLYARRDATDQLRRRDKISVSITSREVVNGVYVVVARATTPDGRTDEAIGAVSIEGLKGDALANAMMKAETKAKRRVTLSICGLGWLDETETEAVPSAQPVVEEPPDVLPSEPQPAEGPSPWHKRTALINRIRLEVNRYGAPQAAINALKKLEREGIVLWGMSDDEVFEAVKAHAAEREERG